MTGKDKRILAITGVVLFIALLFLFRNKQGSATVVQQGGAPFDLNAPELALPDVQIPLLQMADRQSNGYNPYNNPAISFAQNDRESKGGDCCCNGVTDFVPFVPQIIEKIVSPPVITKPRYAVTPYIQPRPRGLGQRVSRASF